MKVSTALLELFKESQEWRIFFRSCCEYSAFRLRAQSWQFRDELKDRGIQFQADEVEDALLGLARELLPNTPASPSRSEEHTSELQSRQYLVCRLLLEKKKNTIYAIRPDISIHIPTLMYITNTEL